MEFVDIINKRLQELVKITENISNTEQEFKEKVDGILADIKNTGESEEEYTANVLRIKEIKKLNSFAMLRVNEVGINIRAMNELYSLLVLQGARIDLSEKDLEILDYNLKNVKPTFILDKNEVVFYSPEVEEYIESNIMNSTEDYKSIIDNIKK